jgi:hypothetical protein
VNDMRSTGGKNTWPRGVFAVDVADGRHSLQAVVNTTLDGLNIYLGGGESPHIGTVAISQPRPSLRGDGTISCTTSVFNLLAHKDDSLAIPLAEILCKKLNQVVVVTAGVHIDKADDGDIARVHRNLAVLVGKIAAALTTD